LGALHINVNGIAEDGNFFSGLADLKFCVDAECRIGVNDQTLLLEELESVGLDLDVVSADGQCGEIVEAFRIAGDCGADAGFAFRGGHRGANDDSAAESVTTPEMLPVMAAQARAAPKRIATTKAGRPPGKKSHRVTPLMNHSPLMKNITARM